MLTLRKLQMNTQKRSEELVHLNLMKEHNSFWIGYDMEHFKIYVLYYMNNLKYLLQLPLFLRS